MATELRWSDLRTLDRDRLTAVAAERLPHWVSWLLVAGIAWQLARMVWLLVPAPAAGDRVEPPAAEQAMAAAAGSARADVQAIAAAHLFGEAKPDEAPPPVEEALEDVAETQLNLSLKGTIAANDPARARAIIASAGRDEKVYAINDTVAPGTRLHAVYPDRVILNRNGALEALKLPKEFEQSAATPVRRSVPTVEREADPNPSIQEVLTENVTKLADVIRPTPYFVGGQQQGYRVYPGRNRKQFAALGLRPGDLIKDVNGASLTDPQQAMEIFQTLGDADQVTVTVERNGQQQVLTLSTSQLTLDNEQ
jgi:general secretion pathway protein C